MKKKLTTALGILYLFNYLAFGETMFISQATIDKVVYQLEDQFGASFRIKTGVKQVAYFWQEKDGTEEEYSQFCLDHFISNQDELQITTKKLENKFEAIWGNFHRMSRQLREPIDVDLGEIKPVDLMFGQLDVSAHLDEDFFLSKIAFFLLLNYPHYNLNQKLTNLNLWNREQWAMSKLGEIVQSRIPAELNQEVYDLTTKIDLYVSNYNIYMGNLVNSKSEKLFPVNLKLISHWGLRDELKSQYSETDGLAKQKMIYQVMQRIIDQTIPGEVVNSPDYDWDPYANEIYQLGKKVEDSHKKDQRYQYFLDLFKTYKKLDPYYAQSPTYIKRKFEYNRQLKEETVENLFVKFISSPEVKKVAELIKKRVGRDLQPFDIWYNGFTANQGISEDKLDRIVSEKFPTIEAFEGSIVDILTKLHFKKEKAEFIASKIKVDPARGAGHATGAQMRSDFSHLRTRVPKSGMDYKGFNIAMHELGHNVEQTLSLYSIDHYLLNGVPFNAFTEAFAFIFQSRDLEILGLEKDDEMNEYLETLDIFWSTFEIMGVSLVDMKVWNWMYENQQASPEELQEAVIKIANYVWNQFYAEIFGVKDQPILAIYSHMIAYALYLPDYPLGHIVEFQIEQFLKKENKAIGEVMEDFCKNGSVPPNLWMRNSIGQDLSIDPFLMTVNEALENIK